MIWWSLRQLRSGNVETRRRAAKDIFMNAAGPGLAGQLHQHLQDQDDVVRSYVAQTLGHLKNPSSVGPLIPMLQDPSDLVRRGVAESLGRLRDQRSVEPLVRAFEQWQGAWEQSSALEALKQIGDRRAAQMLVERLYRAKEFSKAMDVITSLGRVTVPPAMAVWLMLQSEYSNRALLTLDPEWQKPERKKAAVPVLLGALRHPDANLRKVVVERLGEIATSEAIAGLVNVLDDPASAVRQAAIEALAKSKDQQAVSALIHALRTQKDETVRARVAEALAQRDGRDAVEALGAAAADPSETVALAAIRALAEHTEKEAHQAIVHAVTAHGSASVREEAINALGKVEESEAIETLLRACRDTAPEVRVAAVQALAGFEDPRCDTALRHMVKDKDPEVRKAALEFMPGVADAKTFPKIVEALGDDNWGVRETAAKTLTALGWRPKTANEGVMFAIAQRDGHALEQTGPAGVEAALAFMEAGDDLSREAVTDLLLGLGNESSRRELQKHFQRDSRATQLFFSELLKIVAHGETQTRARACSMLGWLGDTRAVTELAAFVAQNAACNNRGFGQEIADSLIDSRTADLQFAVEAMRSLLEQSATAVPESTLRSLATLEDISRVTYSVGNCNYVEEHSWSYSCSQVRQLAKQELARRGRAAHP